MSTTRRWISAGLVCALVALSGSGCTKQLRKARHLSRANRAFEAQRYDEAEIEYRIVLRLPPPDPLALSRLGVLYYTEGKWLPAFAFLKQAVQLQPENAEARTKLGFLLLGFSNTKEAFEQAVAVLKAHPEDSEALLLLAQSAATPQQVQESVDLLEHLPQTAKTQAGYHVARGNLLIQQRELEKALTEFQTAVAQDPKSSLAYLSLGNLYLSRRDLTNAEPALKTSAELAPLRAPARLRYAEFKLKTGGAQEAKSAVQELANQAPDFVPAWVFLAKAAFAEGKKADCDAYLRKALARDPACYDGLLLNGNLMLANGDGTNAITQFERLVKIYGPGSQPEYSLALAQVLARQEAKAMVSLNKALAADTNCLEAILLQATLNIRQGNAAAAIPPLTRMIKKQPWVADTYTLLAKAYLALREPDEAVAVYRGMANVFTNSPNVPLALGTLLALQGKPEEARQALEHSLGIAPEFWPALEQLIDLDLRQDRAPAALERIKKETEKNPGAAIPWLLKAKIHMANAVNVINQTNKSLPSGSRELQPAEVPLAAADLSQAETALVKAIDLAPDLPTGYRLLAKLYVWCNKQQQALARLNALVAKTNDIPALTQIAAIHEQLRDYPSARDAYERVLKVDPNAFEALNNLANLCAQRFGQLDRAYELAEKARQLQPNNAFAADTLGWIVYKRRDYARAYALIDESAHGLPNDPEVQYHLGMAHYMMGEEQSARLALESAIRSSREFAGKDEAAACLALLNLDERAGATEAGTIIEKRLRDVPDDPIAQQRLARLQERAGKFDKAISNYELAAKANPQNPQLKLELAELYDHMNQPDKAYQLAKDAHKLASDDPKISHFLGSLAFRTKDYDWAASLLQDSARKLQDDPEVLYDLAWSYFSLGKISEAQATMQKCSGGRPFSRAAAANDFLDLTAAAQDGERAQQVLQRAQNLLTSAPDYAPALLVCARVEEDQAKYNQAAQLYQKVLAQYPSFMPAARSLALLYFTRLNDDQRAYELGTKVRQSDSEDSEITKILGVLCYRRKEYSRAAQLLEEGARRRSQDAELFYYLGMARYQLKERMQSKEKLQRALALNSAASFADDARRVLQEIK